ncbi:MAG: DUF6063 family protein [Bacilli bacterium]
MLFEETKIIDAFEMYTLLAKHGTLQGQHTAIYKSDDDVRSLLDRFAEKVDCTIIFTLDELHLVPLTKLSPFHINNEWFKKHYLRSGATNADIYLLYFSTIVLFGSFYDSYEMNEPTRDFLHISQWIELMNERMEALKGRGEATLVEKTEEFRYNWQLIIEKWEQLDDLKETAKRQSGNTLSRVSFLDTVRKFLIEQQLVIDIGQDELALTEKAKAIIQRYFMEIDYNKGILEFLYAFERGGINVAEHQ